MTTSNPVHPRRRTSRGVGQDSLNLGNKPCGSDNSMPLRKGDTFHSPLSPVGPTDPILSISNLPTRSLTSPKDLEALVHESQKRVDDIIKDFKENLSLSSDATLKLSQHEVLPVPSAFLSQTGINANLRDIVEAKFKLRRQSKKYASASAASRDQTDHSHDSDSGLGSSVSSDSLSEEPVSSDEDTNTIKPLPALTARSVYSPLTARINNSSRSTTTHTLDQYATNQINKYIVTPLLREEEFKEFHPLLEDVPRRIASKKITCLRDLEKSLIFLAEFKAKSPASYLVFCNTAIQSIHTTVGHLNDSDLRRPTDRPYNNHYFVDLVEQVRQYARIMAVTRQKKANGLKLNENDQTEDEKLQLRVEEGKPAELFRQRADGTFLSIDAGHKFSIDDSDDTVMEADVARSMARKRKCDIGKVEYRTCRECDAVFTRACDLTKHEKTHSRPWKCPDSDCRYHDDGWPTEKERDRHVNDKHSKDAALFKCLFEPCTYSSKRESNCKQHMEKAHDWQYVRAKSKKGEKPNKLVPTAMKLSTSRKHSESTSLPTPASSLAFPALSTPSSLLSQSPGTLSDQSFSPISEVDNYEPGSLSIDHTMTGTESTFDQSIFRSNQMLEHDPLFSNWVNNNNAPLFSPAEVPDLLNTPGTGYTNSPSNSNNTLPTNYDFKFRLSPDESTAWEQVRTYFPNWVDSNESVRNKSYEQQAIQNSWNAPSQNNFTFGGQQELFPSNSYSNFNPTINTTAGADFTLYGYDNTTGYHSSSYGSMFPDLDTGLGQQIHAGQAQEETIYDDNEEDMTMKSQDELMLEQFMNFDGDAQA